MSASRVPGDPGVMEMQIKLAWELYEARSIEEREDVAALEGAVPAPAWIRAQLVGALLEELDRLRAQEKELRANALGQRERELVAAADLLFTHVTAHEKASKSKDWNGLESSWNRVAAAAETYRIVRNDPDWRRLLGESLHTLLALGGEVHL